MPRKILVVATSGVRTDEIAPTIDRRYGADAEVRVIAPASGISRLDWLTNAEDDARREARGVARELAGKLQTDSVESDVGDSDPIQAIDDALRTFDADEVVLVTAPDEDASWLESGAGATAQELLNLPFTHLVVGS